MDLGTLFDGPQGIALASLAGVLIFALVFNAKRLIIAEHKWAGLIASYLAAIGFSATVTDPFHCLAAGDIPGAIHAGAAAVKWLADRGNRLIEGLSVLRKLSAEHPKEVAAFCQDFLAGKDDATLLADAKGVLNGYTDPGPGPVLKQLQHVGEVIQSLGKNASLSDIVNLFASNPVLLPIAPTLTKVVATIHDIGAATTVVKDIAAGSGGTLEIPDNHEAVIRKIAA